MERFAEFLFAGIILGVTEDLIAVKLVTGEQFTLEMLAIVVAVTIPFAAFSELVIDNRGDKKIKNAFYELKEKI